LIILRKTNQQVLDEHTVPALLKRFMGKVEMEPMSGCWLWTGAPGDNTATGQYGRFHILGAQERAHRVSWALHYGPIPDGLHVLHRCDNQSCVNPTHLFLGTNAVNVADRVAKGRSGGEAHPGETHPMARLDEARVRAIRLRRMAGAPLKVIAEEFEICIPHVSDIINRRKWAHVE
jgi:HNH endonuclease